MYKKCSKLEMRHIYWYPGQFSLKRNELIKILKPLHVIYDSGDYWGETFHNNLLKYLVMKNCMSDAALFFKKVGEETIGLWNIFVNDLFHTGKSRYEDIVPCT